MKIKPIKGHRYAVSYEGRERVETVVIDPEGIVRDNSTFPSLGFSLNMTEKHLGISQQVLSSWILKEVDKKEGTCTLKLPSGRCFVLTKILDKHGHEQYIIRIEDLMDISADVILHPGKLRRPTIEALLRFLAWFAVKGFYASTYAQNGIAYTAEVDKGVEAQIAAIRAENEELQAKIAGLEQDLNDAIAFNKDLSDGEPRYV